MGCATSTIVSICCSALGGAGIASTCGRGLPARSSRTWSRDPCTQPSRVAPSSAVQAAASPVAVAEAHSTTRAEPSAAVAKATANTVAPHDPAQPTTGSTCSPTGGVHTLRACVESGRGGRRRVLSEAPVARNSPAWTACQARRSSSTPTGRGANWVVIGRSLRWLGAAGPSRGRPTACRPVRLSPAETASSCAPALPGTRSRHSSAGQPDSRRRSPGLWSCAFTSPSRSADNPRSRTPRADESCVQATRVYAGAAAVSASMLRIAGRRTVRSHTPSRRPTSSVAALLSSP